MNFRISEDQRALMNAVRRVFAPERCVKAVRELLAEQTR